MWVEIGVERRDVETRVAGDPHPVRVSHAYHQQAVLHHERDGLVLAGRLDGPPAPGRRQFDFPGGYQRIKSNRRRLARGRAREHDASPLRHHHTPGMREHGPVRRKRPVAFERDAVRQTQRPFSLKREAHEVCGVRHRLRREHGAVKQLHGPRAGHGFHRLLSIENAKLRAGRHFHFHRRRQHWMNGRLLRAERPRQGLHLTRVKRPVPNAQVVERDVAAERGRDPVRQHARPQHEIRRRERERLPRQDLAQHAVFVKAHGPGVRIVDHGVQEPRRSAGTRGHAAQAEHDCR